MRITSDGKFAVSASDDKTLKVWDLQSAQHVQTLEGHTDRVTALVLTLDDKLAISASFDGMLKLWNLEDGRDLATLMSGHRLYIRDLAITPDLGLIVRIIYDTAAMVATYVPKGGREQLTMSRAQTPPGSASPLLRPILRRFQSRALAKNNTATRRRPCELRGAHLARDPQESRLVTCECASFGLFLFPTNLSR